MDAELCLESGEIDVSYCDIAGGWPGDGNMNANPMMLGNPVYCMIIHLV